MAVNPLFSLKERRALTMAQNRTLAGKNYKAEKGLQEPSPRMRLLLQAHGVAKILKAAKDHDYLEKEFSGYDGLLIIALANALKGDETAIENRLNRMFGKVPDKQVNLNVNLDVSPEQLTERALSLLDDLTEDNQDQIEITIEQEPLFED